MDDDLLTLLGMESADDLNEAYPDEDDDTAVHIHQTARDEHPEWFEGHETPATDTR